MKRRNVLTGTVVGVALLITYALAFAGPREQDSVEVVATGPGGIRIDGRGSAVSVKEDGAALTFSVPLSPVETAVGRRDAALRQALEADRFPAATLRIPRSELRFPTEYHPAEGAADGEFTLRGVSRPVKVHYTATTTPAGTVRVRGSLQLDLRDYSVDALSVFGVPIASLVEVRATLTLQRHAPPAETISELR
jgi:polyisoprenoid-binding protein YceI